MEQTLEQTLEERITQVLRSSTTPQRAVDIARALAVDKAIINKALYRGPFSRANSVGAPTWEPKGEPPGRDPSPEPGAEIVRYSERPQFAFRVGGVGFFLLRADLPREKIRAILLAALSQAPEGAQAVVGHDGSARGEIIDEIAKEEGAASEPFS